MTNAILIFTGKSKETTLNVGGTQSWVLNRARARKSRYAVLTRNIEADWSEGNEPHGSGFMVGRISEVVPSKEVADRWLIKFDEYAEINERDLWPGLRNPVHYTTIEEIGVDVSQLEFKSMPEPDGLEGDPSVKSTSPALNAGDTPLTIAEAKKRLALTFGVEPDAIEITVRG